jgi:RNA polymerase sigma factor (sigma-70 family)
MPAIALAPVEVVEQPAFRAVIVKYVAYACRQGRVNHADFEDVVQQIWFEVAMSIPSFQPEKGTFDNWVRCIALNVIRHHVRGKKRYEKRFCEYLPSVKEQPALDPSPERCLQRKQARFVLSNLLDGLSEQQANVLLLHAVEDLSHGEIGHIVGISESASQKCFQRTRDKMAECLANELLSAMPPFVTGCDEPTPRDFRWHEWSHYSGQILVMFLAFLLFIPANRLLHSPPLKIDAMPTIVSAQTIAMSQPDKLSGGQDEPIVFQDPPTGKPEPAFLPSVPAVSTPTRGGDKPARVWRPLALPPRKFVERPWANRPHVW